MGRRCDGCRGQNHRSAAPTIGCGIVWNRDGEGVMMLRTGLQRLLAALSRVGADPEDNDDLRLHKTLLVTASCLTFMPGLLWGITYLAFDEPLAGAIPGGYGLLTLLSLLLFAVTHRYHLYRFSQLACGLLLPFLLQVTLGGFVNASAVILWSLLCPLFALVLDAPRHAPRWLLAYLGLVVLSGVLDPYLRATNNLPPTLVRAFFVLNLGSVSAISFVLLYYFVAQKNTLLGLLRIEQAKAETLLLNMLPKEIAAILKNEQRTIADHVDGASILFADIVNFTPLTTALAPTEMVELLNELFSAFDALVDQYGVEKIRTSGDSYMVAAGVPRQRPDHAQ